MNQLEPYEERIRELFPELTIESISINREGLLNDAVVVNRELLFRFAKTDFGFKDPLAEGGRLFEASALLCGSARGTVVADRNRKE